MDAGCSNVPPPSHYFQSGMVDSDKAAGVDTNLLHGSREKAARQGSDLPAMDLSSETRLTSVIVAVRIQHSEGPFLSLCLDFSFLDSVQSSCGLTLVAWTLPLPLLPVIAVKAYLQSLRCLKPSRLSA